MKCPAPARQIVVTATLLAVLDGGAMTVAQAATATATAPAAGASAAVAVEDPLEVARARFIAAREALAGGDRDTFHAAIASLDGYPLKGFLVHEDLVDRWQRGEPGRGAIAALDSFARDYRDKSLVRRAAQLLQKRLGETGQWSLYLEFAASEYGYDMPCTTLRARAETGALDGWDETATTLWIEPKKQPAICREVLVELVEDSLPGIVPIWERIYAAIDANAFEAAREVLPWLVSTDRRAVTAWIDAADRAASSTTGSAGDLPAVAPGIALLNGDSLRADTPLNRRIVADLVLRWSREDTAAAIEWWLAESERWTFFVDRYYDTHRALVMRAAYRQMPEAARWLDTLAVRADDLEVMEWRIRSALLADDWPRVMRGLHRLPAEELAEDHWAYWEARALEVAGQVAQAEEIYARLAGLQTWHGFLSADRLGLDYSIRDEPIEVSPEAVAALAADPALRRAREYALVGLASESRREWSNALGRQSDPARLAAGAVLAKSWGLHDRAIFTAGLLEDDARRALGFRFPLLYRSQVAAAAAEHRIEPAWILGVMRRESAFIPDIVSHAGAVGLMQLMPRTADYVANLKQAGERSGDLTDADLNIDFGTFYLGHVAARFDGHPALATASYNAGPNRVEKWLPVTAMEFDRWIDTIPYTETRRYVRAVLAYAAIYEFELTGKPQRLSDKLGPVPGLQESVSVDALLDGS